MESLRVRVFASFSLFLITASGQGSANYDYVGGVSLRYPNTSCPEGTFYEGTSFEPNCCPSGTFRSPGGSAYCCATEADCVDQVEAAIKCADDSWIYCPSPNNNPIGFCCLNGWVCFEQFTSSGDPEGVGCGPPGYVLQVSETSVPTAWGAFEQPGQTVTTTVHGTATSTASSGASTASKQPKQTSGGLSTGAKAGIGIGSAFAIMTLSAVIAWIIFLYKRYPSKQQQQQQQQQQQYPPAYGPNNSSAYEKRGPGFFRGMSNRPPAAELGGWNTAELQGNRDVIELDSRK